MVRVFYPELMASGALHDEAVAVGKRTFELSEFLVKVMGMTDVGAAFPHTVTYHASCHGLRELKLRDEPLQLLRGVKGLKLVDMLRFDECCGFGGTFATKFESISVGDGRIEVRERCGDRRGVRYGHRSQLPDARAGNSGPAQGPGAGDSSGEYSGERGS